MTNFKRVIAVLVPGLLVATSVLAQTTTPPQAPATAPEPEKRICRSTLETGSLVKKHKTCLTKKQWLYVTDTSSDDARRMVLDNTSKPGGN